METIDTAVNTEEEIDLTVSPEDLAHADRIKKQEEQ